MTTLIAADWVVPIATRPIRDGAILVEGGRISAVGPRGAIERAAQARAATGEPVARRDLPGRALLPALVNAHTHLELTWMQGRLARPASMPGWVRTLVSLRRVEGADEAAASEQGIRWLQDAGVGVVGDVSNTLASVVPLSRSDLRAVVFHEVIGFKPADPAVLVREAAARAASANAAPHVRVALAAHAPYSVAPAVLRALAEETQRGERPVTSIHAAESPEEVEFLQTGGGGWRDLLEWAGAWDAEWQPPRTGTVGYLDALGFVAEGTSLVHGVHLSAPEIDRVAARRGSVVLCPRSNHRLGVGTPPVAALAASGVNVAVGTDSLASNDDLSVFAELAALRALAPDLPPARLLEWATLGGARALRVEDEYGSLDAGKRASVIAVAVGGGDVEEQLVRGVATGQIEWVTR